MVANPPDFAQPSIGLLTHDVARLTEFYNGLGFRETFRNTPEKPDHIEVSMEGFTIGISSVEAAIAHHHLNPQLGGRPAYILVWTKDVDAAYQRLTGDGAPSLRAPEDFRGNLRTAWVADPDGNPVNIAQRRS
jgi:catechol 2,3-dioxygenase-like lactoylglutathione lyase family enzyme